MLGDAMAEAKLEESLKPASCNQEAQHDLGKLLDHQDGTGIKA